MYIHLQHIHLYPYVSIFPFISICIYPSHPSVSICIHLFPSISICIHPHSSISICININLSIYVHLFWFLPSMPVIVPSIYIYNYLRIFYIHVNPSGSIYIDLPLSCCINYLHDFLQPTIAKKCLTLQKSILRFAAIKVHIFRSTILHVSP